MIWRTHQHNLHVSSSSTLSLFLHYRHWSISYLRSYRFQIYDWEWLGRYVE